MKQLQGKAAIITGAGTWIGKEIAKQLALHGAKLMLVGRTKETIKQTQKELSDTTQVETYIGDVSSAEDMSDMVSKIEKLFGRVDILVHNASIYPRSKIEDMELSEWKEVIDINLTGSFIVTKEIFKVMKKQNAGKIVYISSIAGGKIGTPTLAHYAASKAGLNGFMRTAAIEFAKYNINVNSIDPGNICNVDRWDTSKDDVNRMLASIPLKRIGKPEDIAHLAVFLASDNASYITGENITVDGGLTVLAEQKHIKD